jgi:hypothetical protein
MQLLIVVFIEVLAEQSFIHVSVWTCMTVQISLGWEATKARERFLWHMYTLITQKYVLIHVTASGAVPFHFFFLLRFVTETHPVCFFFVLLSLASLLP